VSTSALLIASWKFSAASEALASAEHADEVDKAFCLHCLRSVSAPLSIEEFLYSPDLLISFQMNFTFVDNQLDYGYLIGLGDGA